MYAGKAEWLLLFLTQHTRKSIGSKEAVFHGVHFRPCLLCLCVSITSLTSVAALCLSLMLPPMSAGSSHLIHYLFFKTRFFMFIHVYFSFFASNHSFFLPLPSQIMQTVVLASAIFPSLLTNFFSSGLFSVSQPFSLIFFLCLIFILKFKKQLNGVQEQQDPSPPLTHTSHSFLQDHTSPGPQLQSQCPGRSSQASPPYPALPLTHHQLLR